jgi:pimeloyl-ACP methyl ester carboxylesterase
VIVSDDVAPVDETPVFIPSADETLFGLWHRPVGRANGVAVTMLTGAGYLTSSHRNRMYVRLARELTRRGYHVLRIDYHGVGESSGSVQEFRLDQLFTDDLRAAIRWTESRSVRRHVLVGSCFGARTALAASVQINRLEAVALISPPVRDFERGEETAIEWSPRTLARRLRDPSTLKGLLDADRRGVYRRFASTKALEVVKRGRARLGGDAPPDTATVAADFLKPLEQLAHRKIPTLLLYGSQDGLWQHFQQAAGRDLAPVLRRAAGLIEPLTFAGTLHGFESLAAQDAVLDLVPSWLAQAHPMARLQA